MRIICVVKFVPDVDSFSYDHDRHVLIRENSRIKINPDDACAIGFALKMKTRHPDAYIEVLTMAPKSVIPLVEDILRVGVDRGTVISDSLFAGSDTWVTSRVLGRYLSSAHYDCILTGSHAVDGDTSHVPSQIGELLGLNQISCISRVEEDRFNESSAVVEVEDDRSVTSYELDMPAVLSFTRTSGYRLPYVRYKDLNKNVTHQLNCLSNADLGFEKEEVDRILLSIFEDFFDAFGEGRPQGLGGFPSPTNP